jgi:hypothetical protein
MNETDNRRLAERVPVGFYVQQVVDDRPQRCFTADLSTLGVYLEKPIEPMGRSSNVVQVEIPLPNRKETIWAKGEIVYDSFDPLFHGTAIRFTGMARLHQRMLREWLRETKKGRNRFARNKPFRSEAARPAA